MLQLLKPKRLEPMLGKKRSHNEKPAHHHKEETPPSPLAKIREKPMQKQRPNTAKINK